MDNVLSIYEAKTNLSKLVKEVKAGKTIYIGAYGKAEAVLTPIPKVKKFKFGTMSGSFADFDDEVFVSLDKDVAEMFNLGKD